jgi:pimeloyl-ACP methyl ester carboxylesterase
MHPQSDRIVNANGVDLCVETFGDRADPAILLIMGSNASMDWWEDEFCERLAAGSRFVIRYDLRDTGRSVSYEPGAADYTLGDLVADAVGLLDALGVQSAHVVGMSMGGGIAQLVALEHPDRVASLTLVSTAPAAPGPDDPDLPAMSGETAARFAEAPQPDWSDRSAVIDYMTHLARVSAGSLPFDEAGFRGLAGRVFDRTTSMASTMANHSALAGGERSRERLGELRMPALVIHGTEDPVVPYGNGPALAREIPNARLLTLEGMGHELPSAVWDTVVPAMVEHTASSLGPG